MAAFGISLAVIALLVWQGFVSTKGNHLVPTGKIGKVRAQKVDDNEMIVILDFNLKNDSDREMVVRNVEPSIDTADGSPVNGSMIAGKDLANFFRNYPEVGEQYNVPLKARETIAGHEAIDRMVGIRFDMPEETWQKRKDVVLRIEDVTGPIAELKAK
ncbi:MAG: hypothetical protein QOJ99_5606 [Bryobacterales bacterium]|jgi:hypothetical protein|nr:hypothetical protein [Bryobacterales bacterium]